LGTLKVKDIQKNYIVDFLKEKITNFAPNLSEDRVVLSEENTNPVKYL